MSIPRPKIKKTRLWIDNEFIEKEYMAQFHPSVTKVYAVLARHANARTQLCYPSLGTIGRETGIAGRSTVIAAVKMLERYGLIDVIRSPRKSNRYLLRDCRTWLPLNGQSNEMTTSDTSEPYSHMTGVVQPQDPPSHLTGTPSHKSESEKEIMDGILEKLNPMTRASVLSDFEKRRTIVALEKMANAGVVLSSLTLGDLCYHLEKYGVQPIKKHSWINYDNVFKKQ